MTKELPEESIVRVTPGAKIVGMICILAYVLACGIAILGRS